MIETVDRIKALLPQLQASVPPAIKVTIAADRTQTIRASVADVQFTLMLTVALVVMVIFLFLRNFWATVIPAITVPLSLIGTFAVLYVLGYSLDNLSLMALSIAVGFVVDDAVVVIENIVRHLEAGPEPDGSGAQGLQRDRLHHRFHHAVADRRVHPAVPDGRLCRQAVPGIRHHDHRLAGAVARHFADADADDVRAPAEGRSRKKHGRLYRLFERGFDALLALYERGLKVVLRHRFITLMVMLGTIALTGYLYVVIPKGFFPQQDTGQIVGITEAAQDISFPAMAQRQQALVDVLLKDPGDRIGRPTTSAPAGRPRPSTRGACSLS